MDAEDVDVGVFGDAFLDVGVELEGEFFALLGGFGHVHHLGALGFGHGEEAFYCWWFVWKELFVQYQELFRIFYLIGLSGRQEGRVFPSYYSVRQPEWTGG